MNFIDIFVVAVIIIYALIGFWKGFMTQLFQAAGIFCAFYFNTTVSKIIAGKLSDEPEGTVLLVSGIAAFFLILAAFYITGWIVNKTVNFTLTSLPNRIAGIVFGILNGFLTVTLIFILIRLSSAGDNFLKKHVTPDRTTDDIIDRTLDIVSDTAEGETAQKIEAMKEKPDDLIYQENTKKYSRLGYAAYRISAMMDPFVENIRSMAKEKYDEVIEEKVREKIDDIKNDIEE